jgi:class 3 adenylate cyclase/CheY-like chemotaxis protein
MHVSAHENSPQSQDGQLYQGWFSYLRHELRTPVNAILGYSEMIIEDLEVLESRESLEILIDINRFGKRILYLINTLLITDDLDLEAIQGKVQQLPDSIQSELHPPLNALLYSVELLLEKPELADFAGDLDKIRYASEELLTKTRNIVDFSDPEIDEYLETKNWLIDQSINTQVGLDSAKMTTETNATSSVDENLMSGRISGRILVVDDNENNCDLLMRKLGKLGYRVEAAFNGREAINRLGKSIFDLVLLDIRMPYMNGHEVLQNMKAHPVWRHIPVIMISANHELEDAVACIEQGAVDCLSKPFNSVLLKARIQSCLENKHLHDQQVLYLSQLARANQQITSLNDRLGLDNIRLHELNEQLNDEIERRQKMEEDLRREKSKSEELLLNILPELIAEQLKKRSGAIANRFDEVTILFADIANFTQLADHISALELVSLLNRIFSCFDRLTERYGLEKIKTIGDSYLVVGGLPIPRADHAIAIANLALDMQQEIKKFYRWDGEPFEMRIGINTGQVVAGVIGLKKFIYDLWGDAVNVASRMESQGIIGEIQVSTPTYQLLKENYVFEPRGEISIKGKGDMFTYLLKGKN